MSSGNFWEGKKVAVTGGNGFIGSWLTERLVSLGADLTLLIRKDSPRGTEPIKDIIEGVKIVRGDVRSKQDVKNILNENQFVFHLAAITQVLYSNAHPEEAYTTNAIGTLNVLEAIRASPMEHFLIFMSSDKVYGEPRILPIKEEDCLAAKSPYDASKVSADRLAASYFTTYGVKGAIMRPSNTIGGRDANYLRIVPDFAYSILNNKPPVIRGNGTNVRDYTYVQDTVSGLLLAGEKNNVSNGEVFNIGTGKHTSVINLANAMIRLIKGEGALSPVIMNQGSAGEIDRQYLSNSKAKKLLGWEPAHELEEALRESIVWYMTNPSWVNVVERVKERYSI